MCLLAVRPVDLCVYGHMRCTLSVLDKFIMIAVLGFLADSGLHLLNILRRAQSTDFLDECSRAAAMMNELHTHHHVHTRHMVLTRVLRTYRASAVFA